MEYSLYGPEVRPLEYFIAEDKAIMDYMNLATELESFKYQCASFTDYDKCIKFFERMVEAYKTQKSRLSKVVAEQDKKTAEAAAIKAEADAKAAEEKAAEAKAEADKAEADAKAAEAAKVAADKKAKTVS